MKADSFIGGKYYAIQKPRHINPQRTFHFRFPSPSRPDHKGVDFIDAKDLQITERGVYIIAFSDVKVVEVINGNFVGNTVALLHVVDGKSYLTRYQHMRNGVSVKFGEAVKKGQKLGMMGNTGSCISSRTDVPLKYRGTHLHFGIKENSTSYTTGTWVNPEPYLTGEKSMRAAEPVKPVDAPNQMVTLGSSNIVAIQAGAVYGGLSVSRSKAVPFSQLGGKRHTVSAIATHYGEREALLKEINRWVAVKYLVCVV